MLPYKIVNNNKIVVCLASIQYYLHTILLWPVYFGNWCHFKINKKWCIWSLHMRNFLWLPVFELFLQKLHRSSHNYSNFICIYLKLRFGTEKHICLKWVFLPQWLCYTSAEWYQLHNHRYYQKLYADRRYHRIECRSRRIKRWCRCAALSADIVASNVQCFMMLYECSLCFTSGSQYFTHVSPYFTSVSWYFMNV